jgi:hypothetical protein
MKNGIKKLFTAVWRNYCMINQKVSLNKKGCLLRTNNPFFYMNGFSFYLLSASFIRILLPLNFFPLMDLIICEAAF